MLVEQLQQPQVPTITAANGNRVASSIIFLLLTYLSVHFCLFNTNHFDLAPEQVPEISYRLWESSVHDVTTGVSFFILQKCVKYLNENDDAVQEYNAWSRETGTFKNEFTKVEEKNVKILASPITTCPGCHTKLVNKVCSGFCT